MHLSPLRNRCYNVKYMLFNAIFGWATLAILMLLSAQLAYAYFSGVGLDASEADFLFSAGVFLITAYAASRQLRLFIAYIALRRRAKQQIIVAEYDLAGISPAEAGILLDGYGGTSELAGFIKYLQYRGLINLIGGTSHIKLERTTMPATDRAEQVFLNVLFGVYNDVTLPGASSHMQAAYRAMEDELTKKFIINGYLPVATGRSIVGRIIDSVLRSVGFFFQILLLSSIFSVDTYRLTYPRYQVHAWQLLFLVTIVGVLLGVTIRAYRQLSYSDKGWSVHNRIAGLYLYLRVAMKDRLSTGELSSSDLIKYEPYALAFGLDTAKSGELERYM